VVSWAMSNESLLHTFIGEYPSQRAAADALNCSEAQVSRLLNGSRNVTADLAQRIEEVSKGKYCKAVLLWGDKKNH